jgi:hypothetical protein
MELYPQPVQQTGTEYLPIDGPAAAQNLIIVVATVGWRIKVDPATSRIPVIALMVNVMAADREKALAERR